jgi:uncharacterized DUF497 family protein
MLTWDEPKRKQNIKNHGLDFAACDAIWDHFTVTREDKRQNYGEERLVCFGLLGADVVVMVYTERPNHLNHTRRHQRPQRRTAWLGAQRLCKRLKGEDITKVNPLGKSLAI